MAATLCSGADSCGCPRDTTGAHSAGNNGKAISANHPRPVVLETTLSSQGPPVLPQTASLLSTTASAEVPSNWHEPFTPSFSRKLISSRSRDDLVDTIRLNSLEIDSVWRREWDSNPRYSRLHNGFQDRRHRPLGHPSAGSGLLPFYPAPALTGKPCRASSTDSPGNRWQLSGLTTTSQYPTFPGEGRKTNAARWDQAGTLTSTRTGAGNRASVTSSGKTVR